MVRGEERSMCEAGVTVAEIHRRTGRDPKTIQRIRNRPDKESVAKPERPSKLDDYRVFIVERMKQGVLNACGSTGR